MLLPCVHVFAMSQNDYITDKDKCCVCHFYFCVCLYFKQGECFFMVWQFQKKCKKKHKLLYSLAGNSILNLWSCLSHDHKIYLGVGLCHTKAHLNGNKQLYRITFFSVLWNGTVWSFNLKQFRLTKKWLCKCSKCLSLQYELALGQSINLDPLAKGKCSLE